MMNPLLKRQLRKYLPKDLQSNKELHAFLDAVDRSYATSEDQFSRLHRAASISSEELFNSNQQLKEESESQKKIIEKLNNVINTLNFYGLKENLQLETKDSLKLVDFIDNQTRELIEINKQKDKLVSNLERQNQELNEYAHMVSHDLKSPVQSIDALTTWIKQDYFEVLGEGGREIINHIRENIEKIDTLIFGISEYISIGKVEKEIYEVDLNVLINDLILTFENPKGVIISVPRKLPIIKRDQYRLELLFRHLIYNAIKFNDKETGGFVEIRCSEQDEFWQFIIKDNGKGIEEQYFDKIFIAFQKLENDYKSTGIGLSIVKKIIETYEGEIWLESLPNVETIFYFKIKKQTWNNQI